MFNVDDLRLQLASVDTFQEDTKLHFFVSHHLSSSKTKFHCTMPLFPCLAMQGI